MQNSDHRVAIFTDTYAPQMNGVARTLARLADAIARRGGAVRIYTTTDPASAPVDNVVRFPSVSFPMYGDLRMAIPAQARVLDELRRFRPTIAHIATPFGVGLAGRSAARALRLPWVSSYHTSFSAYAAHYGVPWLSKPLWAFLRSFHNSGARTYCPTFAIRDELQGHDFERVHVWSRGVDRTRFAPEKRSAEMRQRMGASPDDIVVAYAGRIAREKGLDDLIGAAALLAGSPAGARVRFAFAGEGPFLEELRGRAPASCTFVGRLEGDALAAFYASAELFAFPSLTDTFGNVLIEAMASGLPVVAAGAANNREVSGAAGRFYTGGDVAGLAANIVELAANDALRAERAHVATLRAAEFDWDAIFDGLMAGYTEACAGHEGAAALAAPITTARASAPRRARWRGRERAQS